VGDIEVIDTELMLADLETADRALQRAVKAAKGGDREALAQKALAERLLAQLGAGRPARTLALTEAELESVRQMFLLTMKPTLYVANVAEGGFDHNPWLDAVRAHATREGAEVVPVCAKIEAEIAQLDAADQQTFLADLGLDEPGLNRVIRAGYRLLHLQTFFTAGPKEVRAWTIPVGATAPQAAGRIHTDFERGFIRAEVIAYEDYIRYGGEQGAKEAGRLRLEGKDYVVADGDVVHFRFNV
jgi:hypothetical protein